MKSGRTAHSAFKIPFPCGPECIFHISVDSTESQKLRYMSLVIWYETILCHRHCTEALDRTLKYVIHYTTPFGGKILLLVGDLRKTLLVLPSGSRARVVNA